MNHVVSTLAVSIVSYIFVIVEMDWARTFILQIELFNLHEFADGPYISSWISVMSSQSNCNSAFEAHFSALGHDLCATAKLQIESTAEIIEESK